MNLSDSRTAGQSVGRPAGQPAGRRPLARLSAAEAVLADLRGEVENGIAPVGAKLPSEAALASRYGVSRSVVREALRSLAALGLTETHTGKGTFVVSRHTADNLVLGQYSAQDLTEARPHIEVPAAGLAARRRSAEELATLEGILAEMSLEDDPAVLVELDASFHGLIARASGNRVFSSVMADLKDAIAHQSETLNLIAARRRDSDAEHGRILEAIRAGDAELARAAMAEHLAAVVHAVVGLRST
ncbi:hypothetical protein SCMU_24400 [Sinomonas cyclohexanicum]|uniref:HTH gntR-type domain-containing protein n=1 Tax=Sinomonas cyclohexanicum TaxID=322009 RepID=A0ABM7PWC3_SINCY|nr:hypothetical protein SCMU_24400 [Corynebacterium cyclohexanicum]